MHQQCEFQFYINDGIRDFRGTYTSLQVASGINRNKLGERVKFNIKKYNIKYCYIYIMQHRIVQE